MACWDARPESALIDADFAGFVLTGPFATLRRAVGASFIGGRSARGARLPWDCDCGRGRAGGMSSGSTARTQQNSETTTLSSARLFPRDFPAGSAGPAGPAAPIREPRSTVVTEHSRPPLDLADTNAAPFPSTRRSRPPASVSLPSPTRSSPNRSTSVSTLVLSLTPTVPFFRPAPPSAPTLSACS